jgi:hypothetical protein
LEALLFVFRVLLAIPLAVSPSQIPSLDDVNARVVAIVHREVMAAFIANNLNILRPNRLRKA